MKILFEYLISSYSLFEDPIKNYVAMAIVTYAAYLIAYDEVGILYRIGLIDGYASGHVLHYIIRFIVFILLHFLFATGMRIINWFCNLPSYKWWIIASVIGTSILSILFTKYILCRKRRIKK